MPDSKKFNSMLLASDYDSTLLPPSGILGAGDLSAIESFIARGGAFTIATGRAYNAFCGEAGRVPMNAPAIISNGAVIYDFNKNKAVRESFLHEDAPSDFARLLELFPSLGMEVYKNEELFTCNPNEITWLHIEFVGSPYTVCRLDEMPLPWTNMLIEQEPEVLLEAQKYILEQWGHKYEAVLSNDYLLEITDKGFTKGGALLQLADMLDIGRDKIFCVGDNQNDISMFEVAEISFAPANAVPQVRELADILVPPCGQGSLAEVIEILDQRF